MSKNVYTLTHTRENLPLKGTQTKGSVTKGGVRAHSVSGSVLGGHPNSRGESPTAKPATPRRTDSTGSQAELIYTPAECGLWSFNYLWVITRQRQANGV